MISFNLSILISDVTRPNLADKGNGSCIDNIASTIHSERIVSVSVEPMVVSDHFALVFKCTLQSDKCIRKEIKDNKLIRPIESLNSYFFISLLKRVSWFSVYTINNIDDKFDYFNDVFLDILDIALPVKHVDVTNSKLSAPKWCDKRLKDLKMHCLEAYVVFKQTKSIHHRNCYKELKKTL